MAKVDWKLLAESPKKDVERLIDFYKKDRIKARTIYHQDKTKYFYYRLVLFQKPTGMDLVKFKVTYGISKTNIIYHREARVDSITLKDGKLWVCLNHNGHKQIRNLTLNYLREFCNGLSVFAKNSKDLMWNSDKDEIKKKLTVEVYKIIAEQFGDLRWIEENVDLWSESFNSLKRHNIHNPTDYLRYKFKVPINIAKIVSKPPKSMEQTSVPKYYKVWGEMSKVLIGIQNLTQELYDDPNFYDSCKMAGALDKKINCAWGAKRLKDEHDKWSKEITATILEYAEMHVLNISPIYREFAKFSNYQMLTTNKEMMFEGMSQSHCVATYVDRVDRGECAIYHIEGYTLQVAYDTQRLITVYQPLGLGNGTMESSKKLVRRQFLGYKNCHPSNELVEKIDSMITAFNDKNYQEARLKLEENKREEKVNNLYGTFNEPFTFVTKIDEPLEDEEDDIEEQRNNEIEEVLDMDPWEIPDNY